MYQGGYFAHLEKVELGHVGTLDPMAEGVLPILLGKSTRASGLSTRFG